ncbi:hypothetical protein N9V15_03045 [Porticoccaceae bacterium]|nr:hypothetical protein [Porticoccaceae bacterium]
MMSTAMTNVIATNRKTAILGMGATGLSAARFLASIGDSFVFADSRSEPPRLQEVKDQYPETPVVLGDFDRDLLAHMDRALVSPGISLEEPALVAARENGVELIGDLELFLQHAKAPVIGITGSNGKSTVTTLLGAMAVASGLNVAVGGNLGDARIHYPNTFRWLIQRDQRNLSAQSVIGQYRVGPSHLQR